MPEIDLTKYPFLVLDPLNDKVAIHLHDIPDFVYFTAQWHMQDDKCHKHFGYDLPVVMDDRCAPITDFSSFKAADLFIEEVRSMTFAQWMGLVEDAILRDE